MFVVNESEVTVEQRQIEVGIQELAKKEIAKGIEPGDKLVTEGIKRLVNYLLKLKVC